MKPATSGLRRRGFSACGLPTVCAAVLAMAAGSRAADTISFNHATASSTAVTPDNQIVWPETAGAPGYNVGYWNNVRSDWSGTAGAIPSPLLDSLSNTVTGLSIGYDGPNCYNNGIATTDGHYKLMRNYMDSKDSGAGPASGYVTLSGVPYRKFDVVVYADGDGAAGATDGPYVLRYGVSARQDDASTEAAMNRTNILRPAVWLKETGNFSGTYTEVGVSTSITVAAAASGNFMVFGGLKGNLTIDPTQTSGTSRAPLNGYQLVKWETANAIPGADDATAKVALYGGNVTVAASRTIGAVATSVGTYGDLIINSGVTLTLANGDLDMGDINHWVKGGGMLTAGNNTLTILRDVSAGLGYVTGAADAAINGVTLVNNGATPLNVVKRGPGKLRMSTANPYTGSTTISQGAIELGNGTALGAATSDVGINDPQTSYFDTGLYLQNGVTLARNVTVSNLGAAASVVTLGSLEAGSQTFSGVISLYKSVQLSAVAGSTVAFSGIVSNSGAITKLGPGTVEFNGSASNNYTGGTTILNGTLVAHQMISLGNGGVQLGDTSGTASAVLVMGSTAGRSVDNSVTVRNGSSGVKILGGRNTAGTNVFAGQVVLGSTANVGQTVHLGASAGGVVSFAGRILRNGTDLTAGVILSNLTGSGVAAVKLDSLNTYAGGTTVPAGTRLIVGGATNAGESAIGLNVAANALRLQGGAAVFDDVKAMTSGLGEYLQDGLNFNSAMAGTFFAVTPGVKMGQNNIGGGTERTTFNDTSWGATETWIYKGQFYSASGHFSFAENIDDNAWMTIDGAVAMNNGTWNTPTTTADNGGAGWGMGPGGDGWHDIEIRLYNGGGGAGAVAGSGWTSTFGFGVNTNGGANPYTSTSGLDYVKPEDPGDMSVFRTIGGSPASALSLANNVAVTADSTLDAGGNLLSLTMGALSIGANRLTVTNAGGAVAVTLGAATLGGNAVVDTAPSVAMTLGAVGDGGIGYTLTKTGQGSLTLSAAGTSVGGTIVQDGTLFIAADDRLGTPPGAPTAGHLTLAGGTLAATAGFTLNANRGWALGPAAGSGSATVEVAAASTVAYGGAIADNGAGSGTLVKTGAGTLDLSGASTYSGGTVVLAGKLLANNTTGSALGSGPLTVGSLATLGGTGVVAGVVVVGPGGKFAAGNSVGTNTVGGLTLTNGAVFEVEADGGGVDQTISLGPVELGGATLSTVALSAPTFTSALILSNATGQITGQFAGLNEADQVLIGAVPYYIHYRPTYVELNLTPTAVVLHQFGAIAEGAGVVVRWRTASEVRTAGFDLYRKVGGEWIKVNDALIAATGAPQGGVGAAYAVSDAGAAAGGTYEYKLVETEQDGSQREYGPYERTATAFEMTSPIRATPKGMEVRWLSREGERYRVLRATDLRGDSPQVIGQALEATPPENVFLDTNEAPLRVYRVEME